MMHILMKAGPLRNGAERGHGSVWHAVPASERMIEFSGAALCGTAPSIQWSSWQPEKREVTCPRCLKKLATQRQA
jgi:hypothetical protein